MVKPRECVVLYPSGKAVAYPSRTACARALNVKLSGVSHCISKGGYVRDLKVIDIDDYSPTADYRYRQTTAKERQVRGTRRFYANISPEVKERLSAFGRENIRRQKEQGIMMRHGNPTVCLTTGEKFPSMREAAKRYEVQETYLGWCIRKGRPCHGMWFAYYKEH